MMNSIEAQTAPTACPLCSANTPSYFASGRVSKQDRDYWRCTQCDVIFIAADQHISADAEGERYEGHNNEDTPEYREHLGTFTNPLFSAINEHMLKPNDEITVLDFGAGPEPLLPTLFAEEGFENVAVYDPFFAPSTTWDKQQYDVVMLTEVAEHFREPAAEFDKLHSVLQPGGQLAIMTQLWLPEGASSEVLDEFTRWHYRGDLTHIIFYTPKTLNWIAERYGYQIVYLDRTDGVVIYRKPE